MKHWSDCAIHNAPGRCDCGAKPEGGRDLGPHSMKAMRKRLKAEIARRKDEEKGGQRSETR